MEEKRGLISKVFSILIFVLCLCPRVSQAQHILNHLNLGLSTMVPDGSHPELKKAAYCNFQPMNRLIDFYGGQSADISDLGNDQLSKISKIRSQALMTAGACTLLFLICLLSLTGLMVKRFQKLSWIKGPVQSIAIIATLALGWTLHMAYENQVGKVLLADTLIHQSGHLKEMPKKGGVPELWYFVLNTEAKIRNIKEAYFHNREILPDKPKWYLLGWDQVALVDYEYQAYKSLSDDIKSLHKGVRKLDSAREQKCNL